MELQNKFDKLKKNLKEMGSVAVAYSGGVDSTFLVKAAYDVLGDKALAITARSTTFPDREFKEAVSFAEKIGIRQIVIDTDELNIEGFVKNPVDRCYHCKKAIFNKILNAAKNNNTDFVADGSNVDDLGDYRPGMQALSELNVVSPLREAGLTKEDIRILSKEMGLPTWDKPSYACLTSRFPYGQEITKEKLDMVDKAEQYLMDLGFRNLRVRHHGDVARIEVPAADRSRFFDTDLMDRVSDRFKKIGFAYTALDLKGYRTGSMNEVILGKGV